MLVESFYILQSIFFDIHQINGINRGILLSLCCVNAKMPLPLQRKQGQKETKDSISKNLTNANVQHSTDCCEV